jgi:type II secretory pathway pseudopilin PulG
VTPGSATSRRRARGEAGETLAEIIVTIAIVGLAVTALVGALATGIAASSGHRQHASADTIARSVAEAIKDRKVDLSNSYDSSVWATVDTSGFDVSPPDVLCLKPASASATSLNTDDFGSCPQTTNLQLVTVTVTSNTAKGEQEFVSIIKRGN